MEILLGFFGGKRFNTLKDDQGYSSYGYFCTDMQHKYDIQYDSDFYEKNVIETVFAAMVDADKIHFVRSSLDLAYVPASMYDHQYTMIEYYMIISVRKFMDKTKFYGKLKNRNNGTVILPEKFILLVSDLREKYGV